ncbi:MAG: DUF1127 domain-containing protein [Kiloniellales bacterium]|nr:DUF1127 domain-containing protein [Kiloniellales bacterium]
MSYLPEDRLIGRRLALRPASGRHSEPSNPLSYVADDILSAVAYGHRHLHRLLDAALAWRRVNRTIDELSRLDDHVLKDIGVNRSEIAGLAHDLEARRRQLPPYWDR